MQNLLYQKELSSLGEYDVVVLGGGPSGVCAAAEAARQGAKVLLAEATGMLGGMATSGGVGPLMTSYDREGMRPVVGGLYREIIQRLDRYGAVITPEDTDSPSIHTLYSKIPSSCNPYRFLYTSNYIGRHAGRSRCGCIVIYSFCRLHMQRW